MCFALVYYGSQGLFSFTECITLEGNMKGKKMMQSKWVLKSCIIDLHKLTEYSTSRVASFQSQIWVSDVLWVIFNIKSYTLRKHLQKMYWKVKIPFNYTVTLWGKSIVAVKWKHILFQYFLQEVFNFNLKRGPCQKHGGVRSNHDTIPETTWKCTKKQASLLAVLVVIVTSLLSTMNPVHASVSFRWG